MSTLSTAYQREVGRHLSRRVMPYLAGTLAAAILDRAFTLTIDGNRHVFSGTWQQFCAACPIADELPMTRTNWHYNLKILRQLGILIVTRERYGLEIKINVEWNVTNVTEEQMSILPPAKRDQIRKAQHLKGEETGSRCSRSRILDPQMFKNPDIWEGSDVQDPEHTLEESLNLEPRRVLSRSALPDREGRTRVRQTVGEAIKTRVRSRPPQTDRFRPADIQAHWRSAWEAFPDPTELPVAWTRREEASAKNVARLHFGLIAKQVADPTKLTEFYAFVHWSVTNWRTVMSTMRNNTMSSSLPSPGLWLTYRNVFFSLWTAEVRQGGKPLSARDRLITIGKTPDEADALIATRVASFEKQKHDEKQKKKVAGDLELSTKVAKALERKERAVVKREQAVTQREEALKPETEKFWTPENLAEHAKSSSIPDYNQADHHGEGSE